MEQQGSSVASRSRFGCLTCRQKHRKCDEQRPVCRPCQRRGLECNYQVTLKWADSHSITTFNASLREKDKSARRSANSAARRRPPSPTTRSRQRSSGRDELTSTSSTSPRHAGIAQRAERNGATLHSVCRRTVGDEASPALRADVSVGNAVSPNPRPPAVDIVTDLVTHPDDHSWLKSSDTSGFLDIYACDELQDSGHLHDYSADIEGSLRLVEPYDDSDSSVDQSVDQSNCDEEQVDSADPDHWVVDGILSNVLPQIFQETSEEIAFTYCWLPWSYPVDISPLANVIHCLDYKRVCICIPAYDSGQNPYRKLAFLSLSYPVLLHGILSVSTAHMHNYGRSNEALLSMRQGRALNSLRAALAALLGNKQETAAVKDGLIPFMDGCGVFSVLSAREIALAAVMMQTSSVLMTGIGNVEIHIKCALEFIRDLKYLYQPARPVFGRLLVYRFAMVDIVLAHLRFRRPLAPSDFFIYQANEQLDHENPSFREMQGCPQRVLSFLAQIARLSADVAETQGSQTDYQTQAYGLETEMRVWGHTYYRVMTKGPNADAVSLSPTQSRSGSAADQRIDLDTVCECFYWVAHILLLRRVFLEPTRSTRVQLVRRHIFHLMDSLQPGCGPDSSLPFPFYMAAREAVTLEERDWVRRKHAAMMEVYRDRSREYMMASTEKIWAKANEVGSQAAEGIPFLDTEYERFIRQTDKQASYFMF